MGRYYKKAWELIKHNPCTVLFFSLGLGTVFNVLFHLLSGMVGYRNPYIIFFSDLIDYFSDAISAEEFRARMFLPEYLVAIVIYAVQYTGSAFIISCIFILLIKSNEKRKTSIKEIFIAINLHKYNLIKTYFASFAIMLIPLFVFIFTFSLLKENIGIYGLLLFYFLCILLIPLSIAAVMTRLLQQFMLCEAIYEDTSGLKPVFKCYEIYLHNFGRLGFEQILIIIPWVPVAYTIIKVVGATGNVLIANLVMIVFSNLLMFPIIAMVIVFYEFKLSAGKIRIKWSKKK